MDRPQQTIYSLRRLGGITLSSLFLGGLALTTLPTFLHSDDSFDDTDYISMMEERDKGVGWNIAFGPTGGYTDVLNGYQDYKNLGNVGLDTYFRPPIPLFPSWKDRFLFRLSADYFPLQVPDYVPYTKEDLFTVSATVIFRMMSFSGTPEHKRLTPFIGIGPAVGWDRISVKHPAVNASGSFFHMGYSASGGVMLPTVGGFRVIPEIRYQSMSEPNQYWTSHISYMVGIAYWPPASVEEQ